MKIRINKETTIEAIQKEFNAYYPYLKIEFFRNFPKNKPIMKAEILTMVESLKHIDNFYEGKIVDVSKERTVHDVNTDFEMMFGLGAHIFRKSGNVWVETSLTEDWTLEDQNKEGEQISGHFE
jgi:hypothetical protein